MLLETLEVPGLSSKYPSNGNMPARLCKRCGRALPVNQSYCAQCGFYNIPEQANQAQNPQQSTQRSQQGNAWNPIPSSPASILKDPQWKSFSTPGNVNASFPGVARKDPPQMDFPAPDTNSWSGTAAPSWSGTSAPNPNSAAGLSGAGASFNPFRAAGAPQAGQPSMAPEMNSWSGSAANSFRAAGAAQGAQTSFAPETGGLAHPQPPSVKKITGKNKKIIFIALAAIVLLAGVAFVASAMLHSSNSSKTASVGATPVPTPTPLVADTFADNHNQWDLQSLQGQYAVSLSGGHLTLEDDNNSLLPELLPGQKMYQDFRLNVDAVLSKGNAKNGYGIYIRGSSDSNGNLATFYRFELYGDRTYAVFKGVTKDGSSTTSMMVNYTANEAILAQGQVNHITLVANGSSLTFIVNGQTLTTLTDKAYTKGLIAFFVSNVQKLPTGAQAKFSNLTLYPIVR